MTEWIKCSDKLPPLEIPVFLYGKGSPLFRNECTLFGVGILCLEEYEDGESPDKYWMYGEFEWTHSTYPSGDECVFLEEITHWMPLPKPPEEIEND